MSLNIVLRSPVSERPYASELCCIPPVGVPYCLGAMRLRFSEYWYTSRDDYVRGRSLLGELGSGLLMPCGQDIINAVDRVYNLLDGAYNGIGRVATLVPDTTNVYTYDPPLEQGVDTTNFHDPGLRHEAKAARWMLDNLVNGTTSDFAPGVAVPNGHLQAIYDELIAMNAEEQVSPEQIAQIISILGAV
jgi:hypothetical protein